MPLVHTTSFNDFIESVAFDFHAGLFVSQSVSHKHTHSVDIIYLPAINGNGCTINMRPCVIECLFAHSSRKLLSRLNEHNIVSVTRTKSNDEPIITLFCHRVGRSKVTTSVEFSMMLTETAYTNSTSSHTHTHTLEHSLFTISLFLYLS